MDFTNLLEIAKQNSESASKQATVKRYSTSLKPSKKEDKGYVRTSAINAFLVRKEQEQLKKEKEACRKKRELLAKRAENSKNSKKAKLMVSRTKDNDFSRIKLTEDEQEAQKKREMEIQRRMIADKFERMKARIEMEEMEKLLPRKRKSKVDKSKDMSSIQNNNDFINDDYDDDDDEDNLNSSNETKQQQKEKIVRQPSQPMNFHELLKLANKKQHEPIAIPKVIKKEERPMTQKERKLHEEEKLRKMGISINSISQKNVSSSKPKQKKSTVNIVHVSAIKKDSQLNQQIDKSNNKSLNNNNFHQSNSNYENNKKTIEHIVTNNNRDFTKKTLTEYKNPIKSKVPVKRVVKQQYRDDFDDIDGFIDDETVEEENIDVSSQIAELFRYDRRRFINNDYEDDDEAMESSYFEQMKEENRSARIGRLEDLEDMRREEEERNMKFKKMKKKVKSL